jgi:hypothetical protein
MKSKINSEAHTETHCNQTFERQRKKKFLITASNVTITCERSSIRLTADFSSETLEARRQLTDIFKVLKKTFINQDSYIWQNCPTKMKAKLKYYQIKES